MAAPGQLQCQTEPRDHHPLAVKFQVYYGMFLVGELVRDARELPKEPKRYFRHKPKDRDLYQLGHALGVVCGSSYDKHFDAVIRYFTAKREAGSHW